MALLRRRKAAQADADDTVAMPFESAPRGVGALLREARLGVGGSIEQIGAALRIRPAYLEAIEEGRSDRLPGPVYALGFVRAYAEHLGLDGAEIVRRFKNEGPGLPERRDLSFPMPLTERSKPGGPVLLVALILAACAYGTWYYLSAGERLRPERITAVPTSLLPAGVSAPTSSLAPAPAAASPTPPTAVAAPAAPPAAGNPTGSAPTTPGAPSTASTAAPATGGAPVPPSVTAPVPASGPAIAAVGPPAPTAAGTTTPPATQPTATQPTATQPTATQAPAAPAPATQAPAAPATTAQAPTTPATAAPATATQANPAPGQPASAPGATPTRPAGTETAALPPVPDDAGAEGPRVYGVTSGPVRIVVKATADSWIQVKDRDLGILQTRILKPGEIFRVPDRPGIVMRTGNAGGLDVTVDGKPVPSLGAAGRTRNVLLEADRLVAGTAGD